MSIALGACTTDSYESGDGEYSYLRSDFSMMPTNGKAEITSFTTDENRTVALSSPLSIEGLKADTVYRALVYYNDQKDKSAQLFNLKFVSVCTPFSPDEEDDMKTDPTGWESMWISNNGSYLNLTLKLLTGVEEGAETREKQVLGVRLDEVVDHHHYFTLYHDQNNVPQYYTNTTYLSVPLDESFQSGDQITMTVNTYDGILSKTILVP